MANHKITELTQDTAPARTDLLYKIDAAGTTDRSVSFADLLKLATTSDISGLGTAATANKVAAGNAGVLDATDATTTNARTPTAHHTTHETGGSDVVAVTHAQTTGQTVNDHHAQLHHAAHSTGGGDAIAATDIGAADAGWFKIGETVLGSSATSIDFSSIPSTYRHLRLLAVLRADVAATSDSVNLVVNNDTTNANYDRQQLSAAGTTVVAAELLAGANARIIGACPAASSPANHFSSMELTVFDYASTSHFKMVQAELSYWVNRSTGGMNLRKSVMGWASTAAVNRLTLSPFTGPNFVAGSVASLYALKAGA